MNGTPYKICPSCGMPTDLGTPRCQACGHGFRTKFLNPPDPTVAFSPPFGPIHPRPQPQSYVMSGFILDPRRGVSFFVGTIAQGVM